MGGSSCEGIRSGPAPPHWATRAARPANARPARSNAGLTCRKRLSRPNRWQHTARAVLTCANIAGSVCLARFRCTFRGQCSHIGAGCCPHMGGYAATRQGPTKPSGLPSSSRSLDQCQRLMHPTKGNHRPSHATSGGDLRASSRQGLAGHTH